MSGLSIIQEGGRRRRRGKKTVRRKGKKSVSKKRKTHGGKGRKTLKSRKSRGILGMLGL